MYWCFRCYARNARPSGPCERCGAEIAAPPSIAYEDRLIWALGHPDGDRALLAARLLGELRCRRATPALRLLVEHPVDPFLAARALGSLIEIEGAGPIRALLAELADGGSFLLARVAVDGLRQLDGGSPPPGRG
jgi:hypothetical protein